MKYNVKTTKRFDKEMIRCRKRGYNMQLIVEAILSGNLQGVWECHIEPDWLMIWEQNDTQLTLLFLQTGTHADLF